MRLLDLDAIFHPEQYPAPVASDIDPGTLPPDWHLQWDERAAIVEADGGLPRERAEALALLDVLEQMRRHGERQTW
jgi:hypothetical protein